MYRTHGDRDKLHQQMSHVVEDVENQGDVDNNNSGDDKNGPSKMRALQDLPMFQTGVDCVDKEIEKLGMTGNCYSVHSVLEKKER